MPSDNPYASPTTATEPHHPFDLSRIVSVAGLTLLFGVPLFVPMLLVTLGMTAVNAIATVVFVIAGQRRLIALASLSCLCWIATLLFTNWGFSTPRPVVRPYWPALVPAVALLVGWVAWP
jgi:hypothetical protein